MRNRSGKPKRPFNKVLHGLTTLSEHQLLPYSMAVNFFFKNGSILDYFCLFLSFPHDTNQYKLRKAYMVCLELESGVAGWKTQTNPLSYGGTPLVDGSNLSEDTKPRSVIWRHFKRVPFQLSSEAGNKIH